MIYLYAKVEYIGYVTQEVESVGQIVGIEGTKAHIIWDEGVMKGHGALYDLHALLINRKTYRITRMSYDQYLAQRV